MSADVGRALVWLLAAVLVVALRAHQRAVWSGLPSCVPVREVPAGALSANPLRYP